MYTLSTPRGIIATDQSKESLEKVQKAWPVNEKTHINEWKATPEKRNSSRRGRSEDK